MKIYNDRLCTLANKYVLISALCEGLPFQIFKEVYSGFNSYRLFQSLSMKRNWQDLKTSLNDKQKLD